MRKELIIEYSLTKPGAYLTYPFGEIPICIKVDDKIFAELYPNEEDYKITLRCEPMLGDFYRRQYPDVVVRGYHCPPVQQPYKNTIYINKIDGDLLLDMIDHSYEQAIGRMTKKQSRKVIGALTKKELVEKGALYFENIQEGIHLYQEELLQGTEEELYEKLVTLWRDNSEENAYVDWYYGTLLPEEKQRIQSCLSDHGRRILNQYEAWKELLFIPLNEELFELTMEMNMKEALFCTYYFIDKNCTVWGNYNHTFQKFTR